MEGPREPAEPPPQSLYAMKQGYRTRNKPIRHEKGFKAFCKSYRGKSGGRTDLSYGCMRCGGERHIKPECPAVVCDSDSDGFDLDSKKEIEDLWDNPRGEKRGREEDEPPTKGFHARCRSMTPTNARRLTNKSANPPRGRCRHCDGDHHHYECRARWVYRDNTPSPEREITPPRGGCKHCGGPHWFEDCDQRDVGCFICSGWHWTHKHGEHVQELQYRSMGPPKGKGKGKDFGKPEVQCFKCRGWGHTAAHCDFKKPRPIPPGADNPLPIGPVQHEVIRRFPENPGANTGERYPLNWDGPHVLSDAQVTDLRRQIREGELPLHFSAVEWYNQKCLQERGITSPEERRKHRPTNNEMWAVRGYTAHELNPKFRRTRKMYMDNPIWPGEVLWYKQESWERINQPENPADPMSKEQLLGHPGSSEMTEILEGLRSLKVIRQTEGRLHGVFRSEEPDSEGKGQEGPPRPNALPLDTAWERPWQLRDLRLGKLDLPVRDSFTGEVRKDLETFLEVDGKGNSSPSGDNMQVDYTTGGDVFGNMENPPPAQVVQKWMEMHFQ